MVKQFRVHLKFHQESQSPFRYQVTKITGPKVVVPVRLGHPAHVGKWLTLEMTDILGERAFLTTT